MKSKLIVFLVSIALLSCSKGKRCYYCEFNLTAGGTPPPPKTVCLKGDERIEDVIFRDPNGNDLTSVCREQ